MAPLQMSWTDVWTDRHFPTNVIRLFSERDNLKTIHSTIFQEVVGAGGGRVKDAAILVGSDEDGQDKE